MRREQVTTDRGDIAYLRIGAGPPLVCLHGFMGAADDFVDVAEAFGDRREIIAPDLRGHGHTALDPRPYEFTELADDLTAFLDALDLDGVDIVGHSLGGRVALRALLDRPQLAASLLLVGTSARRPDSWTMTVFELGTQMGEQNGMGQLAEFMATLVGSEREADRTRRTVAMMDASVFTAVGIAFVDTPDMTPELAVLDLPVTVLVGDLDMAYLLPAQEIADAIPGAVYAELAGRGHCPHIEDPDGFSAHVRRFLDRIEAMPAHIG